MGDNLGLSPISGVLIRKNVEGLAADKYRDSKVESLESMDRWLL
jgi:hypothetical protein